MIARLHGGPEDGKLVRLSNENTDYLVSNKWMGHYYREGDTFTYTVYMVPSEGIIADLKPL